MASHAELVTTIEIKDKHGRVIETKEVVTYAGLLNRAHQEGLRSIKTKVIQAPNEANGMTAISLAEVVTEKGVFRDYGDAHPGNVTAKIAPHLIRMAVTRAKARALRDAINVGVVSLEELGGDAGGSTGDGSSGAQAPATKTRTAARREKDAAKPMTDYQQKYLMRLLGERNFTDAAAQEWIVQAAAVPGLHDVTKGQASELINRLLDDPPYPAAKPN